MTSEGLIGSYRKVMGEGGLKVKDLELFMKNHKNFKINVFFDLI